MSLHSAIQAAQTGLHVSQSGIHITSNNIANASTAGYSRRVMEVTPLRGFGEGSVGTIGRGVGIASVQRQISESLRGRLWLGAADAGATERVAAIMSRVEGTLNELTGFDVSSQMSAFLGAWSELSNLSESGAAVVQQGVELASFVRRVRGELAAVRDEIDAELGQTVRQADELLDRIAQLNREIAGSENGQGQDNTLRDQRDQAVSDLALLVDLSVVEQPDGQYDVLVGSNPAVLGGTSRGMELRLETRDGVTVAVVGLGHGGDALRLTSGRIGGLLDARAAGADDTIAALDDLAASLIFEVNRLHSTGASRAGLARASATLTMRGADLTRALNDPAHTAMGALPFASTHGGFTVRLTNAATGATTLTRIPVDLDGLTDAGEAGFGDDTTLESLRAALDAVGGLSAQVLPDGRLDISAEAGFQFSFQDDSSGVLAALGVNSYFTGTSAASIAVRDDLQANPSGLSAGRWTEDGFIENATALGIGQLASAPLAALDGRGFTSAWTDQVQLIAGRAGTALVAADASSIVHANLEAQRAAISGVSLDEESINLVNYQRQYEGSARVIQVADEMLDTLMALI